MDIIRCVFVIIGAIIGAGFASGKEIYSFFYIYGNKGVIGIFISFILIGYIIFKCLKIIKKYEIENYNEFLKILINKNNIKALTIELIINSTVNFFLIITFFIMCAGISAYFYQEFGLNQIVIGVIVAIVSYIILNKNYKGIFAINSFLIPLVIFILSVLGIKCYRMCPNFTNISKGQGWEIKAVLYASYNSGTLVSILLPMKKFIRTNKDILKIAGISIIISIIMALIIYLLLLSCNSDISKIELPAVYASRIIWKYI